MKSISNPPEFPLNSANSGGSGAIYAFEGYTADTAQWQLLWQAEVVPIHRKSFDLLLLLLRARPRVVGREEIFAALWPDQFVEENNLSQQVSLLRKALSKHGASRIIETVPGRGYRFAAEVLEAPAAGAATNQHEMVLTAQQSITRITVEEEFETPASTAAPLAALPAAATPTRRPLYIVAAVVALAMLGAGGWFGWQRWQNRNGGPPVQVVMIPLEGSTGDKVLDDALGDALRFDMSQSPFVTLVPSATVSKTLSEMRRKPTETLTPELAREVCERTNSQAFVREVLAHSGQGYLLTGDATSCVDGATLASTTRQVDHAEGLPLALNKLVSNLRQSLGESRRSVARFTTPMVALETASLDALKAASQAGVLNRQGKFAESIELDKQAIAYDPDFATAYYDLTADYFTLHDMSNARASITKAYELRNTVSPMLQMTITARYVEMVSGDLREAERNDVLWTQLYPNFPVTWNTLGNVRHSLTEYKEAADAAAQALKLRPAVPLLYSNLAQERIDNGDLASARSLCDQVDAFAPDYEMSRLMLAHIAFTQHDDALAKQQLQWLAKHPDSPMLLAIEAEMAIAEGRFADARGLMRQAADAYVKAGTPNAGADNDKQIASEFFFAGDAKDGNDLFHHDPVDPENGDDIISMAQDGDVAQADRLMKQRLAAHPQDTLLHLWDTPMLHAVMGMQANRPQDTISALNIPGILENRDGQVPYLRGLAYLAAHQPASAEREFRSTLAHPERDHTYAINLAWLGLARALAAEGKRDDAVAAYRHFLGLWQHADPDAQYLVAAKHELEVLERG